MRNLIDRMAHKRTVVTKGSIYYICSTGFSLDYGWQTAVYKSESATVPTVDEPVYTCGYDTEEEAMTGHNSIVSKYSS